MSLSDSHLTLPATLPDPWLEEIKAAVKQSWGRLILTTVLGRSVIGSFVTFGGNYLLETKKANWEMEKKGHEEALQTTKRVFDELPQYLSESQSDKSALPKVIKLFKTDLNPR